MTPVHTYPGTASMPARLQRSPSASERTLIDGGVSVRSLTGLRYFAAFLCVLAVIITKANCAWALWGQVPVRYAAGPGNQSPTVVCADSSGGLFVCYADDAVNLETQNPARLVHVDGLGRVLWTTSFPGATSEYGPRPRPMAMTPDGHGGVLVLAQMGNYPAYSLRMLRFGATGEPIWPEASVSVVHEEFVSISELEIFILADGDGGARAVWWGARAGRTGVFAQHISKDGTRMWGSEGLEIPSWFTGTRVSAISTSNQSLFTVTHEASGASFISGISEHGLVRWTALRGLGYTIYALAADSSDGVWFLGRYGSLGWRVGHLNGNGECSRPGCVGTPIAAPGAVVDRYSARLVADGRGGVVAVWMDGSPGSVVQAQHVTAPGDSGRWAGGATILEHHSRRMMNLRLRRVEDRVVVPVEFGRTDSTSTTFGLIPFQLFRDPPQLTKATIMAVSATTVADSFAYYFLDAQPTREASWTLVYSDVQTPQPAPRPFHVDLFLQRIDADGRKGTNEPVVLSIRDVPQDAGGFVDVRWRASDLRFDPSVTGLVYDVWRGPTREGPWSSVASGLSVAGSEDSLRMPTFGDSALENNARVHVRVDARADNGIFRSSPPDSGVSYANVVDTVLASPDRERVPALTVLPQPARGQCTLRFSLARAGDVRLTVMDLAGRQVVSRRRAGMAAGAHDMTVELRREDGAALPAGLYFVRMEGPGLRVTRRLVVRR